jgi:nicotinate-nucleotide adenylyltransferase
MQSRRVDRSFQTNVQAEPARPDGRRRKRRLGVGLYGGAFDPPHNGHVALARGAVERLGLERLVVLVVAAPGHKEVETDVETRLRLARAAFADVPGAEARRDEHARTIDSVLAAGDEFHDAIFVMGADEFAGFREWKDPDGLLERVRLGVGTRPGFPRERLDEVLAVLERPDRVEFFEIEPVDVSSTEVRRRAGAGEPIDAHVPRAVAELVHDLGLYRRDAGLH